MLSGDIFRGSGDDYTLTTVMGISTSVSLVSPDFVMILTLDVAVCLRGAVDAIPERKAA